MSEVKKNSAYDFLFNAIRTGDIKPDHDLSKVNAAWGEGWELLKNAFKPYACGIVLHPSIDACIALGKQAKAEDIVRIELTVNPYVLEPTGKPIPTMGLAGKFSIYHIGAIAFLEGDAGEAQYADDQVHSSEVAAFRSKITPKVDPSVKEEEVYAKAYLKDGRIIEHVVKRATGSIGNPMDDAALERKFNNLTHGSIGAEQAKALQDLIYRLEKLESLDA